jgi:hypothetical protein
VAAVNEGNHLIAVGISVTLHEEVEWQVTFDCSAITDYTAVGVVVVQLHHAIAAEDLSYTQVGACSSVQSVSFDVVAVHNMVYT